MYSDNLSNMINGWFIGAFEPSLLKTDAVEVAVKTYEIGDFEQSHYHKVATEITVVNYGKVKMFDKIWNTGDIIIVEPGDITSIEAIEKSSTTVVKIPSVKNDKYVVKS